MKTLVLCGDYWHPAQIAREGLESLSRHEFTFDWIEDACDWSSERMMAYPLTILARSNNASSTDQTGSRHGEQPGAWRRMEDKGRVAVLTAGHNLEVWLHPSFQALLINCLRWCAKLV